MVEWRGRKERVTLMDDVDCQEGPGRGWERSAFLLLMGLGLVLRLYHVGEPPIDFLSWRETQTLMIARNFSEEGMNPFSPSVDWRTTAGPVAKGTVGGTELQVTPYLTAVLYAVLGVEYWVNRIIPIGFALLGAGYFFVLIRLFWGPRRAVIATALLTVSPYFLFCGRAQMPEAFAYAMFFAGLYHYARWLDGRSGKHYGLALLFVVLTLLGKATLVVIAAPMLFLTVRRLRWRLLAEWRLYAFGAAVLAFTGAYYAYSYKVLLPQAGLSFAQPSLMAHGQHLGNPDFYVRIAGALWKGALTPPVCVLAVLGLLPWFSRPSPGFAYAWLAGGLLFFLLFPGGCAVNGYYHMVLAPPAVLLAAGVIEWAFVRPAWRVPAVAALSVAGAWSIHTAADFYAPRERGARDCGAWIRENTPEDTLILSASPNPATLYFADRVGWTTWVETYGKGAHFDHDWVNRTAEMGSTILAVPDSWFDNAYFGQYQGIRDDLYDTFLSFHADDFVVFFTRKKADLYVPPPGRMVFGVPASRKFLRGTWGPDQASASGETFAAMGPGNVSSVRFRTRGPVSSVIVRLASAVPQQRVVIRIGDEASGEVTIPTAYTPGNMGVRCPQVLPADTLCTVTLEAARQNENGASLLLYEVRTSE